MPKSPAVVFAAGVLVGFLIVPPIYARVRGAVGK